MPQDESSIGLLKDILNAAGLADAQARQKSPSGDDIEPLKSAKNQIEISKVQGDGKVGDHVRRIKVLLMYLVAFLLCVMAFYITYEIFVISRIYIAQELIEGRSAGLLSKVVGVVGAASFTLIAEHGIKKIQAASSCSG